MNKNKLFSTLFGMALLSIGSIAPMAYAQQSWSSLCTSMTADSVNKQKDLFEARNYILRPSDSPSTSFQAKTVKAKNQSLNLSADQFQRITDITASGFLAIFANHHMQGCSKNYYTTELSPLITDLLQGKGYQFNWQNITIVHQNMRAHADSINAKIEGKGENVRIILTFNGLRINNSKTPSILNPDTGTLDFSVPTKAYPLILAFLNKPSQQADIPITLNNLTAQNPETSIKASGTGLLNDRLQAVAVDGHLAIYNLQRIIEVTQNANLRKVSTALILARFAGRGNAEGNMEWNVIWHGSLLKVNNVPIPIW